jgi:hypothetical protein
MCREDFAGMSQDPVLTKTGTATGWPVTGEAVWKGLK